MGEKTHEQRHRAVKLSLRAQTNFYALKEARTLWEKSEDAKMISDKRWVNPYKHVTEYERSLHGRTSFKSKRDSIHRQVHQKKWISDKKFTNLIPPVPVFDRLNKTYYQGEVNLV